MKLKIRLIVMNFLQYAVWGAYLTCMGKYLGKCGLGGDIGWFYAMQGIVSIFMPALMGIVADRWIQAQRTLGLCHAIAGACMIAAWFYGFSVAEPSFAILFTIYSVSVAFYMPTIALSNSVAYSALEKGGLDTVKDFPPIRVFGTIGFICAMWAVDLVHISDTPYQFLLSGILGIALGVYSFTLPECPISKSNEKKSFVDAFGLRAFTLFKEKKMAIFFIFSMLLGAALQITNGFATPFISSFAAYPEFADTFGVKYSVIIYSISQIAETLCILLIPFFLKRFGIKKVMLMAMIAWFFRFGLFGIGDTGSGVWAIILSMIVYGFAFDFYNISGSLFVNQETAPEIRSSAQGLFMLMTNGLGATIGTLSAQAVVNQFCQWNENGLLVGDWKTTWFIFAAYSLVVAIMFAIFFKYKHVPEKSVKAE
ncbi:MAG: MFS transporter [Bacteroidales bacterium]|nr:MFS transporter [Bacteroidales bacterium]